MGTFSIWHWLILLVVVLVLFGGSNKISNMMGDVAKGIKSFKKGMAEDDETPKDDAARKEAPPKTIEGVPGKPAETASVQANKVG